MKKEKYYSPEHAKGEFNCPHCGVYAKQFWAYIAATDDYRITLSYHAGIDYLSKFEEGLGGEWTVSKCAHCGKKIIWLNKDIVYPREIMVELPNDDLLDDIKKDYLEAATIFNDS